MLARENRCSLRLAESIDQSRFFLPEKLEDVPNSARPLFGLYDAFRGTSIGIYEVTDGSGNRATCAFEVTVYRSSCSDTVNKLVAINGAIEVIDIKGPNVNMTVRVKCNDARYPTPDKPEFFVCDSTGSWLYGEETNDDKIVLYKCGFTDMAEPTQILSESIMGFNTTCENVKQHFDF